MLKKFTLYLFFIISLSSRAQNSEISQLDRELQVAKEDTVRIKILTKFGNKVLESDPEKALRLYREAFALAEKTGIKRKICNAYYRLGNVYRRLSRLDESLKCYLEQLKLAIELDSKSSQASACGNLNSVYENLGNYTLAMEYGFKSIKLYEELKDERGMASIYTNVGTSYYVHQNLPLAIKYFNEALKLYEKLGDSATVIIVYDNLATVSAAKKDYDESLKYAFKALRIRDLINDTIGKAHCYTNIGEVFQFSKIQYDSAIKYYTKALKICIATNDKIQSAAGYLHLSEVYLQTGKLNKALENLDIGMKISQEIKAKQNIVFSYYLFTQIYEAQKDYKKAYEYHLLQTSLSDSLFNADKSKQITEMQTKYETEKKEKEIGLLKFKSQELEQLNQIQELKLSRNWYLILGLSSLAVLIIVVSLLLISRNKLKANQLKMEIEQKLFRSQMNPHFIFNSLIAIQNYVYKHEPSEVAGYISSFAKLMRLILENSRNEMVPIERELTMLRYYLDLQKLRFPEKFDFEIEVDPNIDIESISIPPMLSQPFIENAIEHGIMNKTNGKGLITIKFFQKNNSIEMRICDNGVGRSNTHAKSKDAKHQSLATIITNERMQILNKQSKLKFTLEIVDLKNESGDASGTEIIMCMPEK